MSSSSELLGFMCSTCLTVLGSAVAVSVVQQELLTGHLPGNALLMWMESGTVPDNTTDEGGSRRANEAG